MTSATASWAGGGLHLPQAKALSTVARGVILFGPESYWQGSSSFVLRGGGGSRKLAVALPSVHAPPRNPPPISGIQAYMAYLHSSDLLRTSLLRSSPKFAEKGAKILQLSDTPTPLTRVCCSRYVGRGAPREGQDRYLPSS
jgi:hypothetical protein